MPCLLPSAPVRSAALLLVLFMGLLAPAGASRFALGYHREYWGEVDLDLSQNPDRRYSDKPGVHHLVFSPEGMNNWFLEEPGFIMSLIGGMAQTEANEVEARNQAIREKRGTYAYAYGKPPPIPEGRWFRWGYTSGRWQGAEVERAVLNGPNVKTEEPDLTFLYRRYDVNIIMAPRMIGGTDFYWMLGSTMSGTSLKIYEGGSSADNADDYSYMDTPLNLHMGWQPAIFPWVMLEGMAGYDFIDLLGPLILGWDNYSQGYLFGGKATLGTDWLSVYYDFKHKQDPLYDYGSYSRRYKGNWSVLGVRFDLGNLFFNLMGGNRKDKPSGSSADGPRS